MIIPKNQSHQEECFEEERKKKGRWRIGAMTFLCDGERRKWGKDGDGNGREETQYLHQEKEVNILTLGGLTVCVFSVLSVLRSILRLIMYSR